MENIKPKIGDVYIDLYNREWVIGIDPLGQLAVYREESGWGGWFGGQGLVLKIEELKNIEL